MAKKKEDNNYTISSGNVFTDLNISNPEEALAKAELAMQINKVIKQKNLTQEQAAKLLDVDQPKISALATGRLSGFSLERLFRFLNDLGQDVTISVKPKARSRTRGNLCVNAKKTTPEATARVR